MAHGQATLTGVRGRDVVREEVERRRTRLIEVRRRRVALARREGDGRRTEDGRTGVRGIRSRQGDRVVAGRKVQRTGEVAGLEVVQGERSVDIDVDRSVGDGVKHVKICGGRRDRLSGGYEARR